MKRNILNSPRLLELKKKRQRVLTYKILLSVFAFLLVFASLVYVSRIPSLNFGEVEIIGNKIVDEEMIKADVQKELAGYYLWFFPKTNIFLYPKKDISKVLHNTFFRLKDVSFSLGRSVTSEALKNRKTLEVSVDERTAVYIWCDEEAGSPAITTNQKCYFMDEKGYIFDGAPYFSGEVYFKFYGPADLGTYFEKENFEQLIDFRDILLSLGFKPISLCI